MAEAQWTKGKAVCVGGGHSGNVVTLEEWQILWDLTGRRRTFAQCEMRKHWKVLSRGITW